MKDIIKQMEMNLFKKSLNHGAIQNELYKTYSVKNGLRNEDGTGVLVGLTKISDVIGYSRNEAGDKQDEEGTLVYRGINVKDIVENHGFEEPCLFEEVCFLILFGFLPNAEEFKQFRSILSQKYKLPYAFLEGEILRFPTKNLMNKLQKDVLTLYSYDPTPEDTSLEHILDQGLHLVSKLPSLLCYNYQSKVHFFDKQSMYLHHIDAHKSIAENILRLSRIDSQYTKKEAELLDISLVLHADHGGGNNSTFVNVVMSSTGTDLYSSFAGSIGSLKGPKHGGANLKVSEMMEAVIQEVRYTHEEDKILEVIKRILDKQFYDRKGLVYGMGHAVYTISDPRSVILKEKAKELAMEKGMMKQFMFYTLFEKMAKQEVYDRKKINISSNVDFYSGLVYQMLGIPKEMYTLLFVMARSIGWVAHNLEHTLYSGKIVRPATKYVGELTDYINIKERQ